MSSPSHTSTSTGSGCPLIPNGSQQIVGFIMLCEGFMGIEPHFELWRYFFAVSLVNKRMD
jgi:hypothetical protein